MVGRRKGSQKNYAGSHGDPPASAVKLIQPAPVGTRTDPHERPNLPADDGTSIMKPTARIPVVGLACLGLLGVVAARAAEDAKPAVVTPEAAQFFERKVRPILADHCQKCH